MSWIDQSRLFELARQGKSLTHILGVIPLAFTFAFVSEFGAIPVVTVLLIRYGFTEDFLSMDHIPVTASGLWMALFLVTSFFLIYVLVAAWVWLYERRPVHTLGCERPGMLLRYGRGFLLGLLLFAVAIGIQAAFGGVIVEAGDPSRQGAVAITGVLLVLVGWIVQGGAEEILTRGWVLPVLGARYRPWVGVLVSSLVFAALHALNDNLGALALVNLALFGLFAALYALREGSLWGISAFHSAWNWAQGNIFGFEVSGMSLGGGTIFNLGGIGPTWLTGGLFGPEGGIVVSFVLLLGILAIVFWKRNPVRLAGESSSNRFDFGS